MNGRCHKDALDRAEDICELCGHQFCAHCVLYPRGRRNPPTCKTCALENSGLRGSAGRGQPISKREYKKRKKALLEVLDAVEEERPALEPFELHDPSAFDQSTELDRRIEQIEADTPIDILAGNEQEDEAPASAAPSPPPPSPPPPAPAPAPAPAPSPSSRIEEAVQGLAPVDTSINPLALDTPAATASPSAAEPSPASAADLLARLKADQPIQSQFHHPAPSLDADPFASTTTSQLVGQPTPTPPSAAEAFAETSPPTPATPPPSSQPVTAPAPPSTTPSTTPSSTPKSGTWSPPAPPPRGTVIEEEFSSEPVVEAHPETPPAEDQPPARRKADTDTSGQWIPPSLRGVAAPEDREPLPKRR